MSYRRCYWEERTQVFNCLPFYSCVWDTHAGAQQALNDIHLPFEFRAKSSENKDEENAATKQVTFHSLLVLTIETTSSVYLMKFLIKDHHCVFLSCSLSTKNWVENVEQNFLQAPDMSYYISKLSDLANVWQGLILAKPSSKRFCSTKTS